VYRCPRCKREVVLPMGERYYCKECGPSHYLVPVRPAEKGEVEEITERFVKGVVEADANKISDKEVVDYVYDNGKSISDSTCAPRREIIIAIMKKHNVSKEQAEAILNRILERSKRKDMPHLFEFFDLVCFGWE